MRWYVLLLALLLVDVCQISDVSAAKDVDDDDSDDDGTPDDADTDDDNDGIADDSKMRMQMEHFRIERVRFGR